ncbi:Clathrin light chain, putative [Pediculus humanus corporis]|uniref:Clathrin light chain n=1 Tax=Pediculus humanus subsp. corporis TaxID=121224 RepID=E0V906_PEDHC|nr:Clathrin light chain, putative [Pediculus humanus corporis]EEB09862.1 Clathrin light chain, putative [Pediculus humanus corporis]
MENFGDNFTDVDPAADFLAREQNDLAGLEDDLNPATFNPNTNDGFAQSNDVSSDITETNNTEDGAEQTNISKTSEQELASWETTNITPTPKPVREEPEKIKKWREEQKRRLEEKDANEEKKKEEWRLAAKKELEEWYRHHEDLITKTKAANRNAEKEFVADIDAIQPGTEWERISKLCDFNPKSSKSSKDVSRMRSIILQLKQNPKK